MADNRVDTFYDDNDSSDDHGDDTIPYDGPLDPKHDGELYPNLKIPIGPDFKTDPLVGAFLSTVPLLAPLTRAECDVVGAFTVHERFKPGAVIIKQGDIGRGFYIMCDGTADVRRLEEGQKVPTVLDTISTGDYFGEAALVNNSARGASVVATTPCETFFLSTENFHRLFDNGTGDSSIIFAKRRVIKATSDVSITSAYEMRVPAAPIMAKDERTQKMLYEALKDQVLFTGMENEHKLRAISLMWHTTVAKGTVIIRQGDIGDNLYVLESGKVSVYIRSADGKTQRKVDRVTKTGQCFGELALLYNTPRNATVIAKSKTSLWVLDRLTFRRLMRNVTEEKLRQYQEFLSSVPLFQPLSNNERSKIAEAIETHTYRDGDTIVKEGERGETMYIITSGVVQVSKNNNGSTFVVNQLNRGDYFGERSLLENEVRTATVTCLGRVEVAKIDQYAFKLLLGPVTETLYRSIQQAQQRDQQVAEQRRDLVQLSTETMNKVKQQRVILANQNKDILFQDLEVIGFLGKGGYGHVELVKHRKTKETFALKTLYRSHIIRTKSTQNVLNEKHMLARMDSPHIIRLFATYKDATKLMFLLEPCLGGELFTLLRLRTVFSEKASRFYAASVILALEEIHANGVVYRDLKPENLLLDSEGYIKVTDFGLSKLIGDSRTFTVCGTPHYLAPEIIQGTGHGKAVDLWCLGVLIYEMLAGRPPFYRPGERGDHMRLYRRITCCDYQPSSMFSEDSWDLIQRLLQFKPASRLGFGPNGFERLKKHPWFAGIDWNALASRSLRAPIIPYIRRNDDLTNFKKPTPNYKNSEFNVVPEQDQSWDAEF